MSALPATSPFLPDRTAKVPDPAASTQPKIANQNSGYELVIQIEAMARGCQTVGELNHLMATHTKKLYPARQIFVFDCNGRTRITAISNLPTVDRAAPLVHEFEQTIGYLKDGDGLVSPRDFEIPETQGSGNNALESYPFKNLLWIPIPDRSGGLSGGLLLTSEKPWQESAIASISRLAGTFAHAKALLLSEQRPTSAITRGRFVNRMSLSAVAVGLLLLSFIPVSMTTLAPFEVTSRKPFIIAAPIDGVLEEIVIEPGEHVRAGDPLLHFRNTELSNKRRVAEKEVEVAKARVKRANQLAFDSAEGREELGVAKAELFVRQAQLKLAEEQASRTIIKAPKAGVVVLADKQGLIGKPVKLGQQIMQVADPEKLQVLIRLPVKDSIALEKGARVRLFADSDPLNARAATIEHIDYQATQTNGSALAYRISAVMGVDGDTPLRLGVQGTAHLAGREVPLGVYVLRRPLTTLRQWLGI